MKKKSRPKRLTRRRLQKPGLRLPHSKLIALRKPYWIGPDGKVIDLGAEGKDHATSAMEILRARGIEAGPEEAVKTLLAEDYIRVQVYPNKTAYLQGTFEALAFQGGAILDILPDYRSLEIAYLDWGADDPGLYKVPPRITRRRIDRQGWLTPLIEMAEKMLG